MADGFLENLFTLKGRTAVVVGGTGVLGGALADGLAGAESCDYLTTFDRQRLASDFYPFTIDNAATSVTLKELPPLQ